jgi:hypothetical protein
MRRWTAEEMAFLAQSKSAGLSPKSMAASLGRTVTSVNKKLQASFANGSIAKRNRPWTADDLAFLVSKSADLSHDALAAALNRTVASIEGKLRAARESGLISGSARFWGPERTALLLQLRAEGLTADQIAPRVGSSPTNVRMKAHRCIQHGLIECKHDDWMAAYRAGVPVEALAAYRLFRSKNFSAAEAAAMCREARP